MTHPTGDSHRRCHNEWKSCDKELGKSVTKKATPKSDCGHRPESALELSRRAGADPRVHTACPFTKGCAFLPEAGSLWSQPLRVWRGQGPFWIWPLANSFTLALAPQQIHHICAQRALLVGAKVLCSQLCAIGSAFLWHFLSPSLYFENDESFSKTDSVWHVI